MRELEGKGRGVFALESLQKGQQQFEYRTQAGYPFKERKKYEDIYINNKEGCYVGE